MLPTWRARSAVAVLAEAVPSRYSWWRLSFGDARGARRDVPDDPVIECSAGRIRIVNHKRQAFRRRRNRGKAQRRNGVAPIARVFRRNRLPVGERRARNCHPMSRFLWRFGRVGDGASLTWRAREEERRTEHENDAFQSRPHLQAIIGPDLRPPIPHSPTNRRSTNRAAIGFLPKSS